MRGVHFQFNAWGGLYTDYALDQRVPSAVLDHAAAKRYAAPLVLEGGSIHVDGEGTVLTTEECLLNSNRNPGLSKADIEGHLREYLGATVSSLRRLNMLLRADLTPVIVAWLFMWSRRPSSGCRGASIWTKRTGTSTTCVALQLLVWCC